MVTQRGLRAGEAILGLAILGLGVFVGVETWQMPTISVTAGVGPKFFPILVALGLIATSACLLFEAAYGKLADREGIELDWKGVGIVLAALLIQLCVVTSVGWIASTTFLFAAIALAFGSRRHLLNLLIGFFLGATTYAVFDYGLDLDLPAGSIIENYLG